MIFANCEIIYILVKSISWSFIPLKWLEWLSELSEGHTVHSEDELPYIPKKLFSSRPCPRQHSSPLCQFLKIQYFPQFLSGQLLSQHSESGHKYRMVIWHSLRCAGWSRRVSSHSANWKAVICLYHIRWDHGKGKASEKTQWETIL